MKINEKHKESVENRGDNYIYIGTYEVNEKLENGKLRPSRTPYIRVECPYCKVEYDIQMGQFKRGMKCTHCCNEYEKSFAYHIEKELKLDINDVWDFTLNKINPYMISKFSHNKVWLKCKTIDYHIYEMTCANFSNGQRCSYCNSFASHKVHPLDSILYKYPNIAKQLCNKYGDSIDKNILKNTSPQSHNEFYTKCPKCNKINKYKLPLYSLILNGITCDCGKLNDYYVYMWIRKDLNEVFYIGKGHGNRCYSMDRSEEFIKIRSMYECEVIKVFNNLTEQEAFILEGNLIRRYVFDYDYGMNNNKYKKNRNISIGKFLVNKQFGSEN